MGVSLIAMNHTHEAAKVLRTGSRLDGKGLRDRPAHENARMASLLQLGGLYTQHGKLKSALAVYREALHSHPARYPLQVRPLLLCLILFHVSPVNCEIHILPRDVGRLARSGQTLKSQYMSGREHGDGGREGEIEGDGESYKTVSSSLLQT